MIVKVRIAPVERWCGKSSPEDILRVAGKSIEIISETCKQDEVCGAKAWFVNPEFAKRLLIECGYPEYALIADKWMLCEHMLELD